MNTGENIVLSCVTVTAGCVSLYDMIVFIDVCFFKSYFEVYFFPASPPTCVLYPWFMLRQPGAVPGGGRGRKGLSEQLATRQDLRLAGLVGEKRLSDPCLMPSVILRTGACVVLYTRRRRSRTAPAPPPPRIMTSFGVSIHGVLL